LQVLALRKLTQSADAVLPIDNKRLSELAKEVREYFIFF